MILSAYRPVINKTGAESVWNQQSTHYTDQGHDIDPIEQFDKDLQALVRQLVDKNYHVALGIDANEDLAAPTSSFRESMRLAGLSETIMEQHGPGPPTMT